MQSNRSPPKKSQLGGSMKATSLTHKHNKIMNNIKSLQHNIKNNNAKNKDKDKEPLIIKSSSSNNNLTVDSIPSTLLLSSSSSSTSSSQLVVSSEFFIPHAFETETTANTDAVGIAESAKHLTLPSSGCEQRTTATQNPPQAQEVQLQSLSSTQEEDAKNKNDKLKEDDSNILSKSSGLFSSHSCSVSTPNHSVTVNKTTATNTIDRESMNGNSGVGNNTYNNNINSPGNNFSSCSISNNSSITASSNNKHHQQQHYRDQYHLPACYPYSYSRNSNSLGGSLGSGSSGAVGSIGGVGAQKLSTQSSLTSGNSYHLYNNNNNNNIGSSSSLSSSSSSMGGNVKRYHHRKHTWGTRERAGMSFLIVIAFFAVFGLIILTELFMIDDKNRSGMVMLRHGNINNRMIDSVQPDYDNPKYADYYDQPFGFAQKSKSIADEVDPLRLKTNRLPWNEMLESKLEQTLPHYPSGEKPTDGIWKIVNGTRFKFFVYSAYYDRRMSHLVRVIGATKTRRPERVYCRLWYKVRDPLNANRTKYTSATLSAKVKIIREHWNLKYSAVFVLCPVPPLDIPFSVSIVSRLRAPPGNILKLRNTNHDPDFANRTINQIPDKMAICVKPFHFNYDQALYLIEYLELNSLLGVSHFTFYNHTIGPRAACVLQHYSSGDVPHGNITATDYFDPKELYDSKLFGNYPSPALKDLENGNEAAASASNISTASSMNNAALRKNMKILQTDNYAVPSVEILPWDLRMRSQAEIRTEGLFAALNDCLYRNMYRYKYLALIDVDEFLMPKNNDTLSDLIRWLNRKYNILQVGSYSFQNAFFYLQFADDARLYETPSENSALRGALITQRKTRRRLRLHPQKQRSKYIVNPEAVIEAGNHFVWDFIPGKKTFNVPADAGILHHYRVCEFGGDDCVKVPSILDRTAIKYTNRLLERIDKVYNYLKSPCKLDDLPPAPTQPPPPKNLTMTVHKIKNNQRLVIKTTKSELKQRKDNPLILNRKSSAT